MHISNFIARGLGVKQHGAILGMQMQCNRTGRTSPRQSVIPGLSANLRCAIAHQEISIRLLRDSGFAAGAAPRNDVMGAVNAFLTINWAKIAE